MELERISSILTYPIKSQADGATVSGTQVPMVEGIFAQLHHELNGAQPHTGY